MFENDTFQSQVPKNSAPVPGSTGINWCSKLVSYLLNKIHNVEGCADDGGVFAKGQGFWNRKIDILKGADDAKFSFNLNRKLSVGNKSISTNNSKIGFKLSALMRLQHTRESLS